MPLAPRADPPGAADAVFRRGVANTDEEDFVEALDLYGRLLAAALKAAPTAETAQAGGGATVGHRIAHCSVRRALCRLHLADSLTRHAVSSAEIKAIAEPHLHLAVDDCAVGLRFAPLDDNLHHTLGVANEQLGEFEAAADLYAQLGRAAPAIAADATESLERLQKLQVVVGLPAGSGDIDVTATESAVNEWVALIGKLPWWVRARSAVVRPWTSLVVTGPLMALYHGHGVTRSNAVDDSSSSSEGDSSSDDETEEQNVHAAGQLVGFSSAGGFSEAPSPADVLNLLLDCFIGQQMKPQEVRIPLWMPIGHAGQSGLGRLVMILRLVGVDCRLDTQAPGLVRAMVDRGTGAARAGLDLGGWTDLVRKPEAAVVPALTSEAPPLLDSSCVRADLVAATFSAAAALYRAQPWIAFSGGDVLRIKLDNGSQVYISLQGCVDDADPADPDPESEEESSSGSEGEDEPSQPPGVSTSGEPWTRIGDLRGICMSPTSAQPCGCPHSVHCACGIDRRKYALRKETQRFMWYGSEQHAPCADLDAQEEHSWEVESGSAASFPLPMNILSAGFGHGTRSYSRPSAPELKRLVVLMRVVAGFSAQIRDLKRVKEDGSSPEVKVGVVMKIPVAVDSDMTTAEIVWGSHQWSSETWRKFDGGQGKKDDADSSDEDDADSSDSEVEEEVVRLPRSKQQQVQDQRRKQQLQRGRLGGAAAPLARKASEWHELGSAAPKPFFGRAASAVSESSSEDSSDSSSDSSSSNESDDDEQEEPAGAPAPVVTDAPPVDLRAAIKSGMVKVKLKDVQHGAGESDIGSGFGLLRGSTRPAAAGAGGGSAGLSFTPQVVVDAYTESAAGRRVENPLAAPVDLEIATLQRERQQAREQVKKMRAVVAVAAHDSPSESSSDEDYEEEEAQTMRSLLRKHDDRHSRRGSTRGGDGLGSPVDSSVGGAPSLDFATFRGDGRDEDAEVAGGSLRDAVSVSSGGIMSFAAVEDDEDDGFGQDLYTLD